MKTWKLVSSILFVLLGFCAGVGLNFLPISTTVRGAPGAPEPPPAALKSVSHDATLFGDGTTASPLGIANGGVSAPKLSAAAGPSPGEVLGYNGANLAWQAPPIGGVRVVDNVGQVVGPLVQPTGVLRQIGGFIFLLGVGSDGFHPNGPSGFYHKTPDCSGQRFIPESGTMLWRIGGNTSTYLFYTADQPQEITVNSIEAFPANPNQQGPCSRYNPFTVLGGKATWIDRSTLRLETPFHLEF